MDSDSRLCFWHFNAYNPYWRRQLVFTDWEMPACQDGSTQGECCKLGPHLLVSKSGYAKKFQDPSSM